MGADKKGVGSFFQFFDWNTKSRKKFFSGKFDEKSKQKKRCDGNSPMTRLHLMDEDETAGSSSIKGSSDYSCASSMTDEDNWGTKAPGVVAKLMGLESLPTSNSDPYTSPFSDSDSLRDFNYQKFQKPIEKFQTETLPPKSAKSIPVTHHKLLSPIKRSSFSSSKDAAHVMEAASRIINLKPPQVSTKSKMSRVGSSSSGPLRVKDLREKAEAVEKQANKGKSVSLALQAKENVRKREGLNSTGNKNMTVQKESCESKIFKSQGSNSRSAQKKSSTSNSSSVLRQNNQKQNCSGEIGKQSSKQFISNSQRSSNKSAGSSRMGARRLGADGPYSNTKNVSRKKRCINGDFQYERSPLSNNMSIDRGGTLIQSNSLTDGQTSIVSFTFSAPMARSVHATETSRAFRSGTTLFGSDDLSSFLEEKLRELNSISESSKQKESIAGSPSPTSIYSHLTTDASPLNSSSILQREPVQDMKLKKFQGIPLKHEYHGMDIDMDSVVTKQFRDGRFQSPVSVLDPSFFSESCNSTDTMDSNSTVSKLCSSVLAQEVLGATSLKRLHPNEGDAELSDSASSTHARAVARKHVTTGNWELVYVKETLCHLEPMFEALTMGRVQNVISPFMFDQLESQFEVVNSCAFEPRLKRKVLFDCVGECLDLRCRKYAGCGYSSWVKGVSVVRRKERLAEEVNNEISGWSGMGHCMVDELVDKDMSSKFGRWDDYECEGFELGLQIENRLLNSLIDELVADMLVL